MKVSNSKGKIYYGMHFYPGVAEYSDPANKKPYRVFINEDTIRKMNPTFAGRPIYAYDHVDEVNKKLDELRSEADGWVVESFFNAADGKHWVKFIITSERGERAIMNGLKLSNAYFPTLSGAGGLWNGVSYEKEVIGGEYEHLAIVKNPRYEESVIMTPDEFKAYNEEQETELRRLANSKDNEKENEMKINFFKRTKVENEKDFEGMLVTLPKSGIEKTLVALVNEADAAEVKKEKEKDEPQMANSDHQVEVGEEKMNVGDLVKKYVEACNALEDMKKNKPDFEADAEDLENEDDGADAEDDSMDNADDKEDDGKDDKKDAEKKKNSKHKNKGDEDEEDDEDDDIGDEDDAEHRAKKKNSKGKHFERLRNARDRSRDEVATVDLAVDQVQRGKDRYGSVTN